MTGFFYDNILFILFVTFCGLVGWRIYTSSDFYNLKCVISGVDGNTYCVRDRVKIKQAVDLFATISNQCSLLVAYVLEKYPDDPRAIRLSNKFDPKVFCETLPTSEFTAYSENKGDKIAMCLNRKSKENTESKMIDEHTLMFVAIHELAHIMTVEEKHPQIFWSNFKFLIQNAQDAKIHFPVDYKKKPQEYCGMMIGDNPFYDM